MSEWADFDPVIPEIVPTEEDVSSTVEDEKVYDED